MSTLTKHDCVLGLVGVLVSSNLSSHFNSVPLTSLKVRDIIVESFGVKIDWLFVGGDGETDMLAWLRHCGAMETSTVQL